MLCLGRYDISALTTNQFSKIRWYLQLCYGSRTHTEGGEKNIPDLMNITQRKNFRFHAAYFSILLFTGWLTHTHTHTHTYTHRLILVWLRTAYILLHEQASCNHTLLGGSMHGRAEEEEEKGFLYNPRYIVRTHVLFSSKRKPYLPTLLRLVSMWCTTIKQSMCSDRHKGVHSWHDNDDPLIV